MRIGQDLATTNGFASLEWQVDAVGVRLALTRPPEGALFESDAPIDLPQVGLRTPQALVERHIADLRTWLDAFRVGLYAAMHRIRPALHAEPYVGDPVPDGDVELYTMIHDGGPSSVMGLWWIASADSLAVSIDIGVSRRRRSALWSARLSWGAYNSSGREDVTSHPTARAVLLSDLAAWVDDFREDVTSTAERLGEVILRATGGDR